MSLSSKRNNELREKAIKIRLEILTMLWRAGSGHTGGSLSVVELLLSIYSYMRHKADNPCWDSRDKLVLSKGHAAPALYAILSDYGYFSSRNLAQKGFFLKKPALELLRQPGSPLQGHPYKCVTPGVEVSTGSLGQGLSMANGIALADKKLDKRGIRVYAVLGDGELQEGQVWEAAMTAAHYKLDNLCIFIDCNGLQIDGLVSEIMSIEPLRDKWNAFGWEVLEIDGHDFPQIFQALDMATRVSGKPTVVIAHTIKGKGVSFIENKVGWHGIAPKDDEYQKAKQELEEKLNKLREENEFAEK